MNIYDKFLELDINTSFIGLEKGNEEECYFCTPIGAKVIGWEGCDGIHYCFINGLSDTVFAVNPNSCADIYIYPVAKCFEDFLRLIVTAHSTTAIEQIILWDKQQFEEFLLSPDNAVCPEQEDVLYRIKNELKIHPMEQPFEYVKSVQANFNYESLVFKDEYYHALGLEQPEQGR